MTNQEIKIWAKKKYKSFQWKALGAIAIASILSGASIGITRDTTFGNVALNIGFEVIGFFLSVGLAGFMVELIKDKDPDFEMLFKKFDKTWKQTIVTGLLQTIWVFLYALLLIIPGIIKAFGYSLVPYILAKGSPLPASEVLKLSEEMMNGHKMDYLLLNLSFIGWHILGILTFGILELWILPYHQTAVTKFLVDIMEDYEKSHGEVTEAIHKEETI